MFRSLHRALVRQWLRQFRKQQMVPSVRAVFLGDAVSTQITLDGIYEKYELAALAREVFPRLPHPSTCLDIGANIGNHASFFAKHFQHVVAFEPNPMIHAVLTANTMGRNIIAVPEGVSDAKARLWFYQDFANLGASHIVNSAAEATFAIDVAPLDDLITAHKIKNVSFIKLDVERHEPAALRGGMAFLQTHGPVVAMEAFFARDPALGAEISALLSEAGYRHFYKLVATSDLIRRMEGTVLHPHRGVLRALLPERLRKTVRMEATDQILGHDHQLLICAHNPLI